MSLLCKEMLSIMRNILLLLGFIILWSAHQPLWAADKNNSEEENKAPIISYYRIKPSLVANLASGGRYIRCDVQLMTKDETFLEILNLHGPAIRHILLLLLSEQNGQELRMSEGKEALRKQALSEINQLLESVVGQSKVEALFFTTFFIQ